MRILFLIIILACLAIQYPLWWGSSGYARVDELRDQLTKSEANNRALEVRNNAMQAEIDDLRSGTQALEERARDQLNLVKQGETYVQIIYPNDPVVVPRALPIKPPSNKSEAKPNAKSLTKPAPKQPTTKQQAVKQQTTKQSTSKAPATKQATTQPVRKVTPKNQ